MDLKSNIFSKRNTQFSLMGLAGLVILTLVLIYTGILPFGNNQWSDKNYSKRADVFSVSGGDQSPVFTGKLIIDPAKPKVGEKQYFSIWAKDTDGIKEVTLTIKESTGKTKEIQLKLKEGDETNGKWEGSWKAKLLSKETQYTANFIATNAQKQTTELTTFFDILGSDLQGFFGIKQAYAYGACSFTEIGATSISAPCVIPAGSTFGSNGGDLILNSAVEMATSSTMGAQGGDISISSTITMRTGSTMIFNQGRKISLPSPNSYILKSDDITVIKKGNLSFPNLTVTRSGTGYGTVNFSPPNTSHVLPHSKTYNLGQSVTLTAAANATSTFAGWSGACTNLTGTCTVSMTAAKSVNAIFTTTCQCSGTSVCCDGCNIRPSSTVCRASAGSCDVAETCSGLAVCPADTYQTSSTVCRSSAGACDVAETCSGSSASCPSDLKSTAQCRASAGACDVAESCNGTSNTCPTDSFLSSSSVCRASAGACDVAETCSGSSASCPTNIYAASGTVCATDYQCSSTSCGGDAQYKEKKCTGSGASCPSSWPSSWSIYENCGSTQKCDTDNNSYAQCYEDTCCGSHCGNGTCDCGETTYGTDACNQDCGPCVPQTCNGGPRGDGSCGLYPDGCGGSMNCGDCTMIWTDTCQGCHYAECANYEKGVFYCDTSSGFGTGACRYYCNPDPTCLLNPDGTPKCSS
jgi:hypothetical protein